MGESPRRAIQCFTSRRDVTKAGAGRRVRRIRSQPISMFSFFSARSLRSTFQFALLIGLLVGAAAPARAQIVTLDLGDLLLAGGSGTNQKRFTFDPGTGSVTPTDASIGHVGYFYANSNAPSGFMTYAGFSTFNETWFRPTTAFVSAGNYLDAEDDASFGTQIYFGSDQGGPASITDGYIGLRFDVTGGDTSDAHYGWLRFSYDDTVGLTLHTLAMQRTAGMGITVGDIGAVPEPATVAVIMGLAAGAVVAMRRRRGRAEAKV